MIWNKQTSNISDGTAQFKFKLQDQRVAQIKIFLNGIHIDGTDKLFEDFQAEAEKYLKVLEIEEGENIYICRDIDYLNDLSKFCDGLSTSTICGYTIMKNNLKRGWRLIWFQHLFFSRWSRCFCENIFKQLIP